MRLGRHARRAVAAKNTHSWPPESRRGSLERRALDRHVRRLTGTARSLGITLECLHEEFLRRGKQRASGSSRTVEESATA